MPKFEIEQYELHTQVYRVEAENEAEAIKQVLDGEGDAVDGGLEYIEVCDERGMVLDQHQELVEALRLLGTEIAYDYIPSIRSICKLE